jgi:branched-chain amino acid transport system permease protein
MALPGNRLPCGIKNYTYSKDMAIFRTKVHWGWLIAFLAFLLTMPLFVSAPFLRSVMSLMITIVAVLGLHIIVGLCGQISLGQQAFMAVGGYAAAILATKFGLPFWVVVPSGGVIASMIGIIFGLPSLRIKGFYLAVSTLAAHFLIMYILIQWASVTGGDNGIKVQRPFLGPIDFASDQNFYYIILVTTVLLTFFAKNISRMAVGRAFIAIRDNDLAAEIMGINLFYYKLLAFAISSFFCGVAGALYTFYITRADPVAWPLLNSIWQLGMLIIGGIGSVMGVFFGAAFFKLLELMAAILGPAIVTIVPSFQASVAASLAEILWGLAIVFSLVFEPRGINHRWEITKSLYRVWPFAY